MTSNDKNENTSGRSNSSLLEEIRRLRVNADKGREPELISGRMGTRTYSVAALVERIVNAFIDEHAGGTEALREADSETKRVKLILGTVDYVLAIESVQITEEDKAELIRRAYTELFTYGPLDELFLDENVTTITLEGADKAAVRYGHGELTPIKPLFEDEYHLRKIIKRLLLDSGAELRPDIPIIEAGLRVGKRPVCVSIAGPPVTFHLSADIRVHPAEPVTLESIVNAGMMTAKAAALLAALIESSYGIAIVGESESGKTTLLGALTALLPPKQRKGAVAVERAGELHLPEQVERLVVQWPTEDDQPMTFGDQIGAALERQPTVMLLDEVRADEAPAISPILAPDGEIPRQIWALRGPSDSKRLASALGMVARRSESASEASVRALYERLPFVVTVRRRKDTIQTYSISEWQFPSNADYPDFVELMAMGWDGLELTGKRPSRELDLPGRFWGE